MSGKVIAAFYGKGQFNNTTYCGTLVPTTLVDVTASITQYTAPLIFTVQPAFFGISDPAPGELKHLTVFFSDGTPPDCIPDFEACDILAIQPYTPPPICDPLDLTTYIQAYWGIPKGMGGGPTQLVSVQSIVGQRMIHDLSMVPLQTVFSCSGVTDPAPGVLKTLLLYWYPCTMYGHGTAGPVTEGTSLQFTLGFFQQ